MEAGLSSSSAGAGVLRLVQLPSDAAAASSRERGVARENRAAAGLSSSEARALLGEVTAAALDGGRAAVLSPERRRRVIDIGERLGVRAFDANLVIAVVQDRVRRGENWREWLGSGAADAAREMINRSERDVVMGRLLVIGVVASTLSALMVAWLLGAIG